MGKTKLLITGSGGCLGSNLIRWIFKNFNNYEIASIDYCIHPNIANTIYSNKGHNFHIGTVADAHFIDVIFQIEKPDIVIHLLKDGTSVISDAANKHKCKLIVLNQDIPGATSIRVPFYFGPKQQKQNFVPDVISGILNSKSIPINGMQTRDWIHVQDICSGIVKIIDSGKEGTFDISANNEITDLEMFQEICNLFNRGHELLDSNKSEVIKKIALNNEKLKSLGWLPLFKFKSGLVHTVDWYAKNQWFLRDK
jgi:dTDP-D-glucose 4,6-dehydratase